MKMFQTKITGKKKQYKFCGIKVTVNKQQPSQMNLHKRAKKLKEKFYNQVGYELDLDNPQTFNEKINWMKLYYHDDTMSRIVDKHEFKNYIKEQLGDGYTVPLLGVWDNVDDIDFDKLPNQFVLKSNAQSDAKFIKIVTDKSKLDINELKEEMKQWLIPSNTLITSFCWAYNNVKPKIIAEEYIEQMNKQVYDYKFMCFNGEPKWVLACCDRGKNTVYENHNMNWDLVIPSPKSATKTTIECPKHFKEMVEISKKLSKQFPFVRVDFYEIKDHIYIGEMTFYPNGGYNTYYPQWDKEYGSYLHLPEVKIKPVLFENTKLRNRHIVKILGKKVLSYHQYPSKKELTEQINVMQKNINELSLSTQELKKTLALQADKIKKLDNDLKTRPRLQPSYMRIEERIEALRIKFKQQLGYSLNLYDPQTFNEKINWMKLFYRNNIMSNIVDKHEFKNYIREQLGDGYTVPLLGVWDNVDDIDFDKLPNQFVLKSNVQSDSKYIEIIKNKNETDLESLKEKIKKWLVPSNTLITSYCWAYNNAKPKIIAEEYMEALEKDSCDYKFFCFYGEPKCFYIANNWATNSNKMVTYYDMSLKKMPFKYGKYEQNDIEILDKPENFDEMIKIAKLLSNKFPFVRIDFYNIEGKLYIGEMTFYPGGGYNEYSPKEWEYKIGEWLDLSKIPLENIELHQEYTTSMRKSLSQGV